MAYFSPPETLNSNEPPHLRAPRINSLAYNSPGLTTPFRDPRLQARKPSTAWLLVVVPSPTITQEPQIHTHTLATSPQGRFADGILIPLFPSLYAQLSAVAREFNMPSTVGLCLYLQTTHAGVLTTPRISDETWPLLWNHLSDADSTRSQSGPPIAGRIEFDVDQRKGRWLDAWLGNGASRRISVDVNPPFRAPWHLREDSKFSDKAPFDYITPDADPDQEHSPEDYVSIPRRPNSRGHLRRLSLLKGNELAQSTTSISKPLTGNLPTIISPHPVESKFNPEQELTRRVQSWRENSDTSLPVSHSKPETSFEEVSDIPAPSSHSTVVERQVTHGEQEPSVTQELDLNDFQWSISSLGPLTETSPIDWPSPSISVQLVNRLTGSVCLTATTATSFGPDDESFVFSTSVTSRLPSPDIAFRIIDDVPCTPTTATSWGASSWSGSNIEDLNESESVHLGDRCAGSIPSSPVGEVSFKDAWKQTPWGMIWPLNVEIREREIGNSVWPYNTSRGANIHHSSTQWPYNSARGRLDGGPIVSQPHNQSSCLVQNENPTSLYHAFVGYLEYAKFSHGGASLYYNPSYRSQDAWKLTPWGTIWPLQVNHVEPRLAGFPLTRNKTETSNSFDFVQECNLTNPCSTKSFPYYDAWRLPPWGFVWPYNTGVSKCEGKSVGELSSFGYPIFNIYPAVYPHIEIYPPYSSTIRSLFGVENDSADFSCWRDLSFGYPSFAIYPICNNGLGGTATSISIDYPMLIIYPAVYPNFDIYPTIIVHCDCEAIPSRGLSLDFDLHYPTIVIYPSIYPNFDLYPLVLENNQECEEKINVQNANYPFIIIYPAVYPTFDIYPTISGLSSVIDSGTKLQGDVVRPFGLSPAHSVDLNYYPFFDVYSPTYPDIILYPPMAASNSDVERDPQNAQDEVEIGYPMIRIYSAVYPQIEPYPPVPGQITSIPLSQTALLKVVSYDLRGHQHVYPDILPYGRIRRPRHSHATLHEVVFKSGYEITPSGMGSTSFRCERYVLGDLHDRSRAETDTHVISMGVAQSQHLNEDFGKKSDANLSNRLAGDDPNPSSQVISLIPHLSSVQYEYPVIDPYPPSKKAAQGRIKRLALALSEESTSWDNYVEELLKDSPPIDELEFGDRTLVKTQT